MLKSCGIFELLFCLYLKCYRRCLPFSFMTSQRARLYPFCDIYDRTIHLRTTTNISLLSAIECTDQNTETLALAISQHPVNVNREQLRIELNRLIPYCRLA